MALGLTLFQPPKTTDDLLTASSGEKWRRVEGEGKGLHNTMNNHASWLANLV